MSARRVLLVKVSDKFPKLFPVTAVDYEAATDTVLLDRTVIVEGEETSLVPKARCYEFDPDLMARVNGLTEEALLKMSAARQLCDAALEPADFEDDEDLEAGNTTAH